jgi:hypothetical protein
VSDPPQEPAVIDVVEDIAGVLHSLVETDLGRRVSFEGIRSVAAPFVSRSDAFISGFRPKD